MINSARYSQPQRGFTLIEVMVVIFIGALLTAGVMVSAPDYQRYETEMAARKVSRFFMEVNRQARLSNQTHGVAISAEKLQAMVWTESNWSSDKGLSLRTSNWKTDVRIGGQELTLDDESLPQIIYWSDGQSTPFEWRAVSENGQMFSIAGDLIGRTFIAIDEREAP